MDVSLFFMHLVEMVSINKIGPKIRAWGQSELVKSKKKNTLYSGHEKSVD